jgi:hypothetical protein
MKHRSQPPEELTHSHLTHSPEEVLDLEAVSVPTTSRNVRTVTLMITIGISKSSSAVLFGHCDCICTLPLFEIFFGNEA